MATTPRSSLKKTRPDAPRHASVNRRNNSHAHYAKAAAVGTAKFVAHHPRAIAYGVGAIALHRYTANTIKKDPILSYHQKHSKFNKYYARRAKVQRAKLHYDYFRMKHSSHRGFNRHIQRGYHGRFI